MNSKERVIAAVAHENTDRIPLDIRQIEDIEHWTRAFHVNDEWELRELLGIDVRRPRSSGIYLVEGDRSIWTKTGAKGGHPLAAVKTVREIEQYDWPTPEIVDYEEIKKRLDSFGKAYAKSLSIGWVPVFCTLLDLFGVEDTMLRMYDTPEIIDACVERIEYFLLASMKRLMELCADDAVFFWCGDDFATQKSMMISPDSWRKFLLPTYKKMFALVKSYDLRVWFHSCGTFRPVLPELVDIGMDVWESVQFHLAGNEPEDLKREFGKRITFFGGISTQGVLPFGTPDDVRKQVRERIRVLGPGGGYICGPDHSVQKNIPAQNLWALFDEAKKCAAF
jgi:uroporphyrinogen decarboxylase